MSLALLLVFFGILASFIQNWQNRPKNLQRVQIFSVFSLAGLV